MEKAIQKAIEGGWKGSKEHSIQYPEYAREDPLFWQTLGKAMGWGKGKMEE